MIKVLADQNLYKLADFLPKEVELSFYNPSESVWDLENYDAWLIRTVTRVNSETVPQIPPELKFIGTGSSGNDHVDMDYLKKKGVHFVDAKGCNANAVAEYVATSLLLLKDDIPNLIEMKIGIIGVGAVGQKSNQLLKKLGFETVLFDPPREQRESGFKSASQEEVLRCDILTFHVPLTISGNNKTFHWLSEDKLMSTSFSVVINAARGGVIDEQAVFKVKSEKRIKHLVIDVWEDEPDFNSEFANECFIATPHIAGYSEQAKLNASRIICEELCDYFDLPKIKNGYKVKTQIPEISFHSSLTPILKSVHPIIDYDKKLRSLINSPDKIARFRNLRTNHPFRNEYSQISLDKDLLALHPDLVKLGIS